MNISIHKRNFLLKLLLKLHISNLYFQSESRIESSCKEKTIKASSYPYTFHSAFYLKFYLRCWKKEAACHIANDTLFLPSTNLIDTPPSHYRNKKCNSTNERSQKLMHGKSLSEHKFLGVGCNFRVFEGIFPGVNKIQGFSGSSRVCRPPRVDIQFLERRRYS